MFVKTGALKRLQRNKSGSCHQMGASNDKFSVQFGIFVIVVFFNPGRVLKFGAPSRYNKGALFQER